MTRDEFMKHAEEEIDAAFRGQRNRMMNLVERAWAEGKRNAEMERIDELGKEIIDQVKKSIVVPYEMKLPGLPEGEYPNWQSLENSLPNGFLSDVCKTCGHNPLNGGNGICHCVLGTTPITC